MCGFVAWLEKNGKTDAGTLARLRDLLRHRGPDDAGLHQSADCRVGLGFRRLSIIDLSVGGHQPMASSDGAAWIVFNGEVYNFAELRPELESRGHVFHSRSDSEVVLHAYLEWGEACVERFVGMFAFAIWDERRQTLFAVRDRLGIKPLYYSATPGRLIVASELKPIAAAPRFNGQLDGAALREFLGRGYVTTPRTIFRQVRSLPPAHTLSWTFDAEAPVVRRYWNPLTRAGIPVASRSDNDWADELDALLRSAVRYRLVSDVPLGAFLSGGIDSSLVVALMRQVATGEVRTFTVGFNERAHDEADYAAAIARHLGTRHTALTATEAEAREVIPLLADFYDEPFADASQIPTYLVSRLTRKHVTVALSGDGGDELFCGYDNYARLAKYRSLWSVPRPLRRLLSAGRHVLPDNRWRRFVGGLGLSDAVAFSDYMWRVWRSDEIDALLPGLPEADEPEWLTDLRSRDDLDSLEQVMLRDLQRYLPDDILTKVDRASMAVGLEARVPLLDHRVVEFAASLPLDLKYRNGTSKFLLRKVLERYVPRSLIERRKHGFNLPLDTWLRGELRELIDHLLAPDRLRAQGLFVPEVVARHVQRFLNNSVGPERVWALLVFQMWVDRYGFADLTPNG